MMAPELSGIHMNSSFEVPSYFGRAVKKIKKNGKIFLSITPITSQIFGCLLQLSFTELHPILNL